MDIQKLLELTVRYQASDLHLMVGVQPYLRVHGRLVAVPESEVLTPQRIKELVHSLLNEEQRELLQVDRELDFSYALPSGARFRINAYHEKGNISAALRLIPSEIRSLEQLGMPPLLADLTTLKQGLILITGPTGHGKSTTLAAMISRINKQRSAHIVTIEDPIEYVHLPEKSILSQRELHADTHSWAMALRSVLREDPDVVLIGEMRDYETIAAALTIAETGHLVFATLHTNSAGQTIDRIVDVFPDEQQQQIRSQLASSLEAVLSQRLIPSVDGKRMAVMEIMLASPAVRTNIREGKSHLLNNIIQTSGDMGMRTLEAALAEAYFAKRITAEVAREYAVSVEEVNRLMSRGA